MVDDLSIAAKLGVGFGAVIFFSFILTVTGWIGLESTIDSSDKMSAILHLNKVISDTKAARENYLRSMTQSDQQILSDNIELMNSILRDEESKYDTSKEKTIINQAIKLLKEYKEIYDELVLVVEKNRLIQQKRWNQRAELQTNNPNKSLY